MNNFFKHLKLINKHRLEVFKLCAKCGLFWRGLVHDLSKYSRVEFFESVKYFVGTRSPIGEARKSQGYSLAWIHHINKNKHHFEYWYDAKNKTQINIPYKYAVEHICDTIAASKCYNKNNYNQALPLNYWLKQKESEPINECMKAFFTKVLNDLANFGEKKIINKKYLKQTYKDFVEKI